MFIDFHVLFTRERTEWLLSFVAVDKMLLDFKNHTLLSKSVINFMLFFNRMQ